MNTRAIILGFSLVVSTALMSEANIPIGDFSAKLSKMAGEQGQFYVGKEDFPKDYFLVPNNLPFLAGLSLYHPMSSTLNLSDEQIKAIQEIKKRTIPPVVKSSQDIKRLELKLAQNIAIDTNTAESQYEIVDAIGKLRIALTKAHLKCINEIREILSKEQYKTLLSYATNMGYKPKSNKFRIDELVFLPHPGKFIKEGQIATTKEQRERITNEIKAVYAPYFQGKIREAFDLEKKVQRMIAKDKSAKDVSHLIDQIMKLKREAISSRIEALSHIRKILSKEQWKKVNKLTYK